MFIFIYVVVALILSFNRFIIVSDDENELKYIVIL